MAAVTLFLTLDLIGDKERRSGSADADASSASSVLDLLFDRDEKNGPWSL